jgi:hypothetical protein
MRTQVAPESSERNSPSTFPTVPARKTAGAVRPGAALPNPSRAPSVTPSTRAKPPSPAGRNRPAPPAVSHSPPFGAGTGVTPRPSAGSVAALGANVAPPSVLT